MADRFSDRSTNAILAEVEMFPSEVIVFPSEVSSAGETYSPVGSDAGVCDAVDARHVFLG